MKKGDMKTIISTCCNALTTLYSGDEGTNHYICSNCGEACDFKAGAPVERVERQTGQTMTELNERVVNYFRTYKGMYSQNDVEKLLATARAEGAQEERERIRKHLNTKVILLGDIRGANNGTHVFLFNDVEEALTTKEHHAK